MANVGNFKSLIMIDLVHVENFQFKIFIDLVLVSKMLIYAKSWLWYISSGLYIVQECMFGCVQSFKYFDPILTYIYYNFLPLYEHSIQRMYCLKNGFTGKQMERCTNFYLKAPNICIAYCLVQRMSFLDLGKIYRNVLGKI